MIMNILGSPTEEDIQGMQLPAPPQLPKIQGKGLALVLKQVDPNAIDLISRMLLLNPKKRVHPFRLLSHPFFDPLWKSQILLNNKPIADLFDFTQEEIGENQDLI